MITIIFANIEFATFGIGNTTNQFQVLILPCFDFQAFIYSRSLNGQFYV